MTYWRQFTPLDSRGLRLIANCTLIECQERVDGIVTPVQLYTAGTLFYLEYK